VNTIACMPEEGHSTWLGNAAGLRAASLLSDDDSLLLRVAALQNRCLTPEIHCCCQQSTHTTTPTATTALDSLSVHRREYYCLCRNALLTPASLGAFLEESPCPTGFRSRCNTTSVRSVSLRRTPIHRLRYGSGKPCSRRPNSVYYACTLRSACVCARLVTASSRLLQRHVLTPTTPAWQRYAARLRLR
jgi:hypothetical protein